MNFIKYFLKTELKSIYLGIKNISAKGKYIISRIVIIYVVPAVVSLVISKVFNLDFVLVFAFYLTVALWGIISQVYDLKRAGVLRNCKDPQDR